MLLCLALQIAMQMQNADADADAKQMQSKCRVQNALQMQIALQIGYQKNTQLKSQTACAPEALGRIAHAHSAGPGTLDPGPLAKESSARKRDLYGGKFMS